MTDLASASREELLAIIATQQAEIGLLGARVAQLEEEVGRLRGAGAKAPPTWVKPNRPKPEERDRKRRGQGFARRREAPDAIVEHGVEQCPKCGRKLLRGWCHRSHQVIEIVLPQMRVIEHRVLGRFCSLCNKRWLPKLEGSALGVQGQRRFGASVQSLVAALNGAFRIPLSQIRRLLFELWGLRISKGELVALVDGVVAAGEKELKGLQEAVRGRPVVNADETGWRQDGQNGWLWAFVTPRLRYFLYRKTRSGTVPEEVLGDPFKGRVVCDFYAAYNRLLHEIQRCWAHLLRDLHELKEKHADSAEVIAWAEAVQALYEEAKAFSCPNALWRQRKRAELEDRLEALARPVASRTEAPPSVLAQRIVKHLSELFVFVEHPEVPADNNLAERSLRPAVIARKICGGTRSDKGSETKMGLLSLTGTWTLQNRALLSAFRKLILTGSSA